MPYCSPPPRVIRCETKFPHAAPEGTPPFVSPDTRTLWCPVCEDWTEFRRVVDYDQAEKAYACGDCGYDITYWINPFGIDL